MKKVYLAWAVCLLTAGALAAQSNPASRMFRGMLMRNQHNMVGSAEAMPAAKYGYRATPKQWTFRHLIEHATMANNYLCAVISGATPKHARPAKNPGKAELVKALRASYAYCHSRLAQLTDADMNKPVTLFGRMHTSVAGAMLVAAGDWSDHYAQAAFMLRLNGLLPPSAQHGRMRKHK